MKNQWILKTYGDPLNTMRDFIKKIWTYSELDYMLLPQLAEDDLWYPALINSPKQLDTANPFTPLMTMNAAREIPAYLEENPGKRIGALLRPCEMRALHVLAKREQVSLENLVTISVDCLGTFSDEEFAWRADRKGTQEKLAEDDLQFARQGGILAYRYRSACQACHMPIAKHADINIGVVGLPIRQHFLVHTPNGIGEKIPFDTITQGSADEGIVAQYQEMADQMLLNRKKTRENISQTLLDTLVDIEHLSDIFSDSGECESCMEVCPLFAVDKPEKQADGRYRNEDILQWMISCVGCGMCEQECEAHKPLAMIFSAIRNQLTLQQ